jgi:hypothetical protein
MNRTLALLTLAGSASLASAQSEYLMYVDSILDEVALLDPATGEISGVPFIDDANSPTIYDLQTPFEALQVGNEVWLTDGLADSIFRFTAEPSPTFLGSISGQLDLLRGLALVGNRVYVANAGTANGAPGDSIVIFETNGTRVGHIVITNPLSGLIVDPVDVEAYNGRLLITDIESDDLIVCDVDGSNAQVLVNGTSNWFRTPQQVKVANTGPGGATEFWVNTFSTAFVPAGPYRFDASGALIAFYPNLTTGGRGIWPLPPRPDGGFDVLYTDGVSGVGGLRRFDPQVGTPQSLLTTAGGRFISKLILTPPIACNDIDINNDGSLFDPVDIDAFLSVFSEGPCVPETSTCDSIDFNNDGSLFDPCDIDSFLLVFSEGPCTLCGV